MTLSSGARRLARHSFLGVMVPCSLLALELGGITLARAADSDPSTSSPKQLQEVVVTAEKRAESLDKVPIAVSVLTRDQMMQRQIYDMAAVAAVTPGVDFENTGSTIALSIRGISSGISGYSTTGIYIDDVPVQIRLDNGIVPGTDTTPLVFDLDRVEVLKGPQGTLFGAGAEGGAIRFIQAQPSLTQFSGYTRAGVATTDGGGPSYEFGAAFGGPIVDDKLGFRVSAWHERQGGYIDHDSAIPGGADEPHSGWRDADVLRAALTLAPIPSLQITPSLFYQHIYWNDVPTFDPGWPGLHRCADDELEHARPDLHERRRRAARVPGAAPAAEQRCALPALAQDRGGSAGRHLDLQHLLPLPPLQRPAGLHDGHAGHHRPALAHDRGGGGKQLDTRAAQRVRAGVPCHLGESRARDCNGLPASSSTSRARSAISGYGHRTGRPRSSRPTVSQSSRFSVSRFSPAASRSMRRSP